MLYLVRLTERASRDMESIYDFIEAETSAKAFAWFNGLAKAIYSLERFPERGRQIPKTQKVRQLFFGTKPNTYQIIFALDERNRVVNVLQIRHGARAPFFSNT
jgi:plasmid stabilization system protein ParE